jgi:predicted lipoprotein with Yx(FWY)xxD motif
MPTQITTSADRPTRGRGRATSRRLAVVAMVGALAVAGAACSSSKKNASTDTNAGASTTVTTAGSTTTTAGTSGAAGTSVAVATTSLGPVVVDDKGLTLYFFKNDTGSSSTCVDACAKAWPAATVTGTPKAGDGVTATLTTTTRADGTTQLVLNGHPLYRFSGDTKAGDVSGQDIGDVWYAAGPDGQPVE